MRLYQPANHSTAFSSAQHVPLPAARRAPLLLRVVRRCGLRCAGAAQPRVDEGKEPRGARRNLQLVLRVPGRLLGRLGRLGSPPAEAPSMPGYENPVGCFLFYDSFVVERWPGDTACPWQPPWLAHGLIVI